MKSRTMKSTAMDAKSKAGLARKMSGRALLLLVVCALAVVISPTLYGQATGSFSGNVLDKSGSGVAGASVTVTSQTTGLVRDGKTDNAGHYLVPLLPVGIYTVRVDSTGFQTTESKDLNLLVDQARELDFSLSPASVSSTITVTGNAVAVETANASLGQVITSQQVSDRKSVV